jgi:hypothetical protein
MFGGGASSNWGVFEMRMMCAAVGGLLALSVFPASAAFAGGPYTIVADNGCVIDSYTIPGPGGIVPPQMALCAGVPGMVYSRFSAKVGTNFAEHTHRAIYVSPEGPYPPFTVESTPDWTADGFLIRSWVGGFASFQGNPGDEFAWSVRMEATYAGVTIFSEAAGVQTKGGNFTFGDFDALNCKGCPTGGPFVSKLIVTLSGPGELHLENTGVGRIGPVPEPGTWAMMILGFGLIGAAVRRKAAVVMAQP